APSHVIGSADMNFAETVASLNDSVGASHPQLQTYLTQHHAFDLAVGEVFVHARNDYAAHQSSATAFADAVWVCAQHGLPKDIAYCALLAHLPAGATDGAAIADLLAQRVNTSQWTV